MSRRDRVWLVVLVLCLIGVLVAAFLSMRREKGILLHSAIAYGSLEDVMDIVGDGVDIDFLHDDKTPLLAAALEGHEEIVDFLLDAGADPALAGPDGASLLDWVAASAPSETFFRFFGEDHELSPNKLVWGEPILFWRLLEGFPGKEGSDRDVIRYLIGKGADVNVGGSTFGMSCMHLAAGYWDFDTVRLLCEAGADVNLSDFLGRYPMHFAVVSGVDKVKVLLEHGARLDVVDRSARTPLELVRYELETQLDAERQEIVNYDYIESLNAVIEYLESLNTTH